MDQAERTRYKQLANNALIAYFGTDGMPQQPAEALERCVEELEGVATCTTCGYCDDHGELEDDSDEVFIADNDECELL